MRKSSKDKYVDQPKRQSSRLRGRSAPCKEEDATSINLSSKMQDSVSNYIIKQLEFDMQNPEDFSFGKSSQHINSLSDSGSDDHIDITLKDFQQKCKSKKRKSHKPAASSQVNVSQSDSDNSPVKIHDYVKVKEEPDLEEPLIVLKQKISMASTRARDQRKRCRVDPLVSEENDNFVPTASECSLKEGFPSIITETASTYHELSDNGAPVLELKNVQEKSLMERVGSFMCSVARKGSRGIDIPELFHHIDSDILEACSLEQHAEHNDTVSLSSGINGPELIEEVAKEGSERQQKPFMSLNTSDHSLSVMKEASLLSVSELKNGIHVDEHLTNIVKNLPENEELSSTHITIPDEKSTEHEERNEYASLPVVDVDVHETKKVALAITREESSQFPASTSDAFYPNSVSATVMYPDAGKCGRNKIHDIALDKSSHESRVNDMESTRDSSYRRMVSEPSCTLTMIIGGTRDSTDSMTLQDAPICSQVRNVDNNCNLPSEEVYGLEEIFLSSTDKLNGVSERVTWCPNEFSNIPDPMGFRGKSEVQPSRISSSCISVPIDLQSTGGNLLKAIEDLYTFSEEKLKSKLDQLVCSEKLYLVNSLGKRQAECDQSLMECCSPKKLLSNRQTISPTSQEKLCWTLNGIYIHDGGQISGESEVGYLFSPEQTKKKPRNKNKGSLSPIKKANVRPTNTSCKLPCSSKNSLTMHMEKAVAFSQRQMHDIENLATQLLRGLNSMRTIVEETLNSEIHNFMASKFTVDEIRAANGNALELEKTAKKWLTIMTRDCNRFCKIMKVADNKSADPVNGACRERRKITFADEVGGVLCQVKVFESQQTPDIAPESQQAI